jgi:hypothetical protein
MYLEDHLVKVIWAEKVFEDIYEVSFKFIDNYPYDSGFQLWFVKLKPDGGFEPICCSMYISDMTKAIRLKQEEIKNESE